jgi:hypothetical protein
VKTGAACLLFSAVLTTGCSDAAAPSPGMFRARLSGALVATMSGPSNAGTIFTEASGTQFAIRMFTPQGDTLRSLSIACPGEEPPATGTYAVNESGSDCVGGYGSLVSTLETGTIILEQLSASSGSVTISPSSEGQIEGIFSFAGTLVVGSDSVGSVAASGAFSADVLP